MDPIELINNQSKCNNKETIRTASESEQQEYNELRSNRSIETLADVFTLGLTVSDNGPCIGKLVSNGQYEWTSYSTVYENIVTIGLGLRHLAILSGSKFNIGLIASKHLADCCLIEFACYNSGLIVVPLDDNLTPKDCALILEQLNIGCVIVDTPDRVHGLIGQSNCLQCLKFIVVIESIIESFKSKAFAYGLTVKTLNQVIKIGEEDPIYPEEKINSKDIALIIHSNGSTGKPKGIKLTHDNILSNAIAVTIRLGNHKPNKCDILFCYMPITQMYQRCFQIVTLMAGGRLGFSGSDLKQSWKNMESLKPTLLVTIPHLIKSLHDKLFLKVKGNLIAEWFLHRSLVTLGPCSGRQRLSIWQSYVLSRIRNRLGGNLRLIIVAKSHLPRYLMNFIRLSLGAKVFTSYGLKETSGPCTMSFSSDQSTEHVGFPLPNVSIKLIPMKSLQELNLTGEICVKGDNLFQGYLCDNLTNCDKKSEGWHLTGDIGFWRSNQSLEIISHSFDILRLDGDGKLIGLRKIESIYNQSQFVDSIYLHGEPEKPLIGIVNPAKYHLNIWARENGLKGTYYDICKEKKAHEEIIADLRSLGRQHGLEPYQQIKVIALVSENFTQKKWPFEQYFPS